MSSLLFYSFELSVDLTYAKDIGVEDVSRGNNVKFFGPPVPRINDDRSELPVQYTAPYFDCGRSNKWIVSAVAPIYDRLARYVYDPNAPISLGIAGIYDELRENKYVFMHLPLYGPSKLEILFGKSTLLPITDVLE